MKVEKDEFLTDGGIVVVVVAKDVFKRGGSPLNGYTLITGKHLTYGCYTGDLELYTVCLIGTFSGHKGNISIMMMSKKGHCSNKHGVIFDQAQLAPSNKKFCIRPWW